MNHVAALLLDAYVIPEALEPPGVLELTALTGDRLIHRQQLTETGPVAIRCPIPEDLTTRRIDITFALDRRTQVHTGDDRELGIIVSEVRFESLESPLFAGQARSEG